jgi:tRNA(Ile)-lysidine synthase
MSYEVILIETIRQTIQKFQLISPDSRVVVGVSGGADSLALLHILYTLQRTFGCQLHVATLNHGLRGEDGAEDARYIEEIAGSWGLAVKVGQADVRAIAAQERIGIESAARKARYDFLAGVAAQVGAGRVAVAHHADDQAETVLMHLIRGAGGSGLRGMSLQSPMVGHPELMLIRPLLRVTRTEIELYCAEHGLQPREDTTNKDVTLLRNYLRWEIVPRLASLNSNIQQMLAQTADITQVENDYLEGQFQLIVDSPIVQREEGRIKVDRKAFHALHPALQRRFVAWAARQIKPELEDLGYQHIVEAVEIGLRGRQGVRALLTEGLQLRADYGVLWIEDQDAPPSKIEQPLLETDEEIEVSIPGVILLLQSQWSLHVSLMPFSNPHAQARLALPEGARVRMRGRQEGDRFGQMGLQGHTQKLNRWMINRKIPAQVRDHIPLLCVNGEVAAIFVNQHWFIGEAYKVETDSQRVVHFQFLQNL